MIPVIDSGQATQGAVDQALKNCCNNTQYNEKSNILLNSLVSLIKVYRNWVSPFLPASCRFYPTCSEYAMESFQTLGLWRGIYLSLWRILRCNPLHPGGVDPVPDYTASGSPNFSDLSERN
ncbi:MAG: membrane protein insertion efficiency factor YidD [SAR324 cluster bacterium]|nr:membrane protein insertion efficiency factor YidD [SAR324 cluster bacterium]MBL7034153.1 membrane protein insertion efficiency factor YidD [SAR324 cluster bacterium]